MKIILVLVLMFIFLSCGSNLPMGYQLENPYIVVKINRFGSFENFCQYELDTGRDYVGFKDNITLIDSIGKFAIGDTVVLSASKSKKIYESKRTYLER